MLIEISDTILSGVNLNLIPKVLQGNKNSRANQAFNKFLELYFMVVF